MVAYKEEILIKTIIVENSEELYEGNFITKEQLLTINKSLPRLKSSKNLIVRILFFILGVFLYSSICGSVSLMFLSSLDNETIWKIAFLLFAAIGIAGMEVIIVPNMKFYKNGLDDAFVLGIILCFGISSGLVSDFTNWIMAINVFVTAGVCYFRYLSIPALIVSAISLIATIAFVMINHIIYGSALLPIVLAGIAVISYRYSSKLQIKITKPYYYQGTVLIKYFSIIVFYTSLNYAVITELSSVLMPNLTPSTFSIIMSYIFIILTTVIPPAYIYYGLKRKDKPLFVIGLLAILASYFTLRFYYQFLSLEIELISFGILLFAASYIVMTKIKNNLQGITFLPDRLATTNAAQLEILASVVQFGRNTTTVEPSPMEFGGGGFSGGGAGESF